MERSAFSRAWEYTGYAPFAKSLALLGAAVSGASYGLLILLLALFADLMIWRGHMPSYSDLGLRDRRVFHHRWNSLSPDERTEAVAGLAVHESQRASLAETIETEEPRGVRVSAQWQAYQGLVLRRRAGDEAASEYRRQAGAGREDVRLGSLSLVVRSAETPTGWIVGWFSSWNPWMWQPDSSGRANRLFPTGLLLMGVGVAMIRALLVSVMHRGASRATLEAVTRLRRLLYHHTFRLGSLTVASEGPREAVGIFARDVNAVHDGLYARLTVAMREPIKLFTLVILALVVNVWLGIASLFAASLVWLLGRQAGVYFRRRGRHGSRRAMNQLALLEESLGMMRLVKAYLMEPFNQTRVERQLSEYARAQHSRFRSELVYRPLLVFLGTLAGVGLLFVAGAMVMSDHLNPASIVVLAATLVSMYFPLDVWMSARRLIQRAEQSAAILFDFLDRRGEVGQVVGAEFLKAISKKLELDKVSLREPGTGRMLLDNVSLTIEAGQRVAIVGFDDAEKQAVASLLPRFLDPSSGEILIDGRNIRWVTLDSLRSQTALVAQRELVFNDTVANNIGCGDPSFSIPQIIEAAKSVHAHHFIQRLPHGYETRIGTLGHSLTTGEKFRIALARAVLRDPAILIIEEPDEPLDEGTKRMLDDTYARILAERTVILFPHRLSTLKSCDRVFMIHEGKLVCEGQHRDLLHDNELYRHLYYLEYYVLSEQA